MAPGCVYLVRHGETAWSKSGQHTGRTDIDLTPRGEEQARRLAGQLKNLKVDHVFSSPLRRAQRTCELAGFGGSATLDRDLLEWDYGRYEGKTLAQIHEENPGWDLFRDGCPGGESVSAVLSRADRVVTRLETLQGNALLFSSGHLLRVLAARWLGKDVTLGRNLALDPASISILGYEHAGAENVIRLWNDTPLG